MSGEKIIAIVGRTNVGKSTLFNRLCGREEAIVHDMPGVTRDRQEGKATLGDLSFKVIDTAGLEEASVLSKAMWKQTEKAIEDSDIVLMVVDARSEINPLDLKLAEKLRPLKKPVFLLANKCEENTQYITATESYRLGLGDPIAISAEQGNGMADLYQAIVPFFPQEEEEEIKGKESFLKVAIVGRPNVGKSTLVNRLLGQERMLTGSEAGVTRDAISVDFEWKGHSIVLTDTAGLRRRSKVDGDLERVSAEDTRRALNFAEVVIVVIDSNTLFENQDLQIARQVVEEGRAMVIAVNKWDMVKDVRRKMQDIKAKLHDSLQQVKGVPVVAISAAQGDGLDLLMKEVFHINEVWNKRIQTHKLNEWLKQMTQAHPPPVAKNGRRIPMRYMTQTGIRPPTFVIFSSNPGELPESYLRYLSNGLRNNFALKGIPIRIYMRKRENPYAKGKMQKK